VLLSNETDKVWDERTKMVVEKKSQVLIFPRYHQLELLRKLKTAIRNEGVGNNYLIQHTTGSGKSYSIGWLAHTLVSLYRNETDTQRMFDTIIVITDRKVLDEQLQATVSKLQQTDGVVNPVDLNSKQLMEYLEKGKDIIITTVQKFPVISEAISQLKSKTFGVIIDEVHSSQSGETSRHLKKSLSKSVIQQTDNDDDTEEETIDYEDKIREEILARGRQPHISFFGFTGTPKNKTLELFGRKNEAGEFVSFHSYTMKQSIFERFTLDVLKYYTTYKRYFKVMQTSEEDQELPEGKVKRELVNFVDSHEKTISDKVAIMLDHFVRKVSKTISGRGRAMVVVRSRKHCVLFHEEMVKQMKERGLPYSCLVAFSGTIYHNGIENTEISLNTGNGMKGKNIADGLKDPRFRILIVSNKFQTGFDEPLLQSMYVDKKLGGVQCVQTLSRLNRTTKGKTETFVLDFANDVDEIVEAFQPYYTTTVLSKETDPDKLYELVYQIEEYNLYTQQQLESFCIEFYADSVTDQKLQYHINGVVKNYKEKLNDKEKDEYKSKIQSYIRLYSYISQISSFTEIHWEKTYIFFKCSTRNCPKGKTSVFRWWIALTWIASA
jgi:type I restriction enzyme, R subunit